MNNQVDRRLKKFHYSSNGPVEDIYETIYLFDRNIEKKIKFWRIIIFVFLIVSIILAWKVIFSV